MTNELPRKAHPTRCNRAEDGSTYDPTCRVCVEDFEAMKAHALASVRPLRSRRAREPHPAPPKPGKEDVTAFLLDAIAKRRELGLKKYGTSLQTWNGRDPLADAMEEDLDRMQYLVQARRERADMLERIDRLENAIRRACFLLDGGPGLAHNALLALMGAGVKP